MIKETEKINPNSKDIDQKSALDFVECFLNEEKVARDQLEKSKKQIATVIEKIYEKVKDYKEVYLPYKGDERYNGPRIFYFGAGTSGRLGILDASECPPTFSAHPDFFNGIIAGGEDAIRYSVENAEDDKQAAKKFIEENICEKDIVIGISANGNAPYVVATIMHARQKGALSIAIANNKDAEVFKHSDLQIFLNTGPEIISGSTRLKAGTAQKMTLNMISTGLMIKLNKVYGNLMVDLQVKNAKLKVRAVQLVGLVTGIEDQEKIIDALEQSSYRVKEAILMLEKGLSFSEASETLEKNLYKLVI